MEQKINSHIGKKLLDMLMFSMYPDAKIIYREYVQNAFDSINAAVEQNILNKTKDGIVSIKIDPSSRNIVIRDNGTGIPIESAPTILTSIADSPKDGIEQAGVYGIGRLVGAGYCNKLEFRTSAKGEDMATVLSFDVNKTSQILDNDSDTRTATEVMNSIISWDLISEKKEEHYFEVILHNVKEEYPILLSEDDIIEYLKEVAPIDYEMPFKNNIMYTSIEKDSEFDALQKSLNYIKLSVNNHLDIRKRYGNTVVGTGDEIVGLQYFTLEDEYHGRLAWGWFAITKFTKAIPASDPNKCIRLRKLNIQVGEANYLNEYFDEARGNNYFYGEIHACHKNLRPNTSRAGLTPTVEATIFFKKLKEYFKNLKDLYTLANKAKNAVRDIEQATAKINQEGISEQERKEAEAALSTGKKKLESATKAASNKAASHGEAVTKVVEQYASQVTTNTTGVGERTEGYKENDTNNNDNIPTATTPVETQTEQPVVSTPVIQPQPQDVFEPLKNKYSKEQIWVIRKLFKSLSDNCPKGQLPLIEDLKKMAIKDLL